MSHTPEPLEVPMRPPGPNMPDDERQAREFLARYRCPGPPGARWTEAHVARLLRTMRNPTRGAPA